MKVLICDDHRLFAEAFAYVLTASGHEVIGCVASPDQAVQTVTANDVDVCVMDLHFPTGSGVEGIARVLAASPGTRVVALTGNSEPLTLATAIDAGAHGVAVKEHDIHQVIRTVERVHAGEMVEDACRSSATSGPNTSGNGNRNGNGVACGLTAREREVLGHLVHGASTVELAQAMTVSYSTARTHIQNVLTKLGVHSKLEAIAVAVSNEIVPLPRVPSHY
ncbi:MAG: response regulator transcription factor [Actinobacteria bacterium]|nr:response regulator transcription factor [Actinomycetota bacterium]